MYLDTRLTRCGMITGYLTHWQCCSCNRLNNTCQQLVCCILINKMIIPLVIDILASFSAAEVHTRTLYYPPDGINFHS